MSDKEQLKAKLQGLSTDYAKRLPGNIDNIHKAWEPLSNGSWNREAAYELRLKCHSLSGTGATFGYPEVSELTRNIEQLLTAIAEEAEPDSAVMDSINKLVLSLSDEAPRQHRAFDPLRLEYNKHSLAPLATRPIFLVDDNIDFAESLALQLAGYDYDVHIFHTLAEAEQAIEEELPGAVIMDLMFPEGPHAGAEFVRKLKNDYLRKVPVLFISVQEDIQARLEAVRAGSDAYFVKPLDPKELAENLDIIVAKSKAEPYRVVLVDDEVELSQWYASVLNSVNVSTQVINDPMVVMEALVEHRPDIIIIDLHMPNCNGLELANVLRQHSAYRHMPILFLSSETDLHVHFEARENGVDDFLLKPIQEQHLISAVINRSQRARSLSAMISHEGMTGLLTHDKLKRELERHAFLADRYRRTFSFCMLDLDNFKQINDRFGHLCGDSVIKKFAAILKDRLRRSDVIGRYGGEEFGIILPDESPEVALSVMEKIRLELAETLHRINGVEITVTVSGGIAGYPCGESVSDLIYKADKALYLAKAEGKNRLYIA